MQGFFQRRSTSNKQLVSKSTELLVGSWGLALFRGASQPAAMSANPIASIPSPLDDETSRDRPHPPRGVASLCCADLLGHRSARRLFPAAQRELPLLPDRLTAIGGHRPSYHCRISAGPRRASCGASDDPEHRGCRMGCATDCRGSRPRHRDLRGDRQGVRGDRGTMLDWPATNGRRRTRIVVSFSLAMPASIGASSTGRRLSSGRPRRGAGAPSRPPPDCQRDRPFGDQEPRRLQRCSAYRCFGPARQALLVRWRDDQTGPRRGRARLHDLISAGDPTASTEMGRWLRHATSDCPKTPCRFRRQLAKAPALAGAVSFAPIATANSVIKSPRCTANSAKGVPWNEQIASRTSGCQQMAN